MKSKLTLSLCLTLLMGGLNAQVNYYDIQYNSPPGIGCHTNFSVCVSTSEPESGAEIIIDWTDGDYDTLIFSLGSNTNHCYPFQHDYSIPGIYHPVIDVKSGIWGGQSIGSEWIDWNVTSTTHCGFFNIISLLNPSATLMSNVPYDVTNGNGITTTIYPIDPVGSVTPYYTELDVENVPYTVSVNDAWLANNGYIQTSPDFTISSFEPGGIAHNVPSNVTLECADSGTLPDLAILSAAAFQFIAPLEKGDVVVQVCNTSCGNSANNIVKIAIPNGVTPDLTDLPGATFANDTVTILISNLTGCTSIGFECTFAGNTPAGTVLNFYVEASATGEEDFMFNSSSFVATVLNSYDPNDKQCNLPEFIQPDVKENLSYTVRFQNDGNFPALNVVVRDTISSNLDLSTFRFIGSKHPASYGVDPATREVVFRFSGINLQPSVEGLAGSQGFFTYAVDELADLPLNSEIKNTAYIYFDFNPAIITNTTSNKNAYLGVTAIESDKVSIVPNPASGKFTLELPENGSLKIYSVLGSLVLEQDVSNHEVIDVTHLEKGMYQLQISSKRGTFSKKLLVD